MKRSTFLKVMAAGLVLSVSGDTPVKAATVTPATEEALEYMALDAAITAMNRLGATRDTTFWPYIYARLGEAGLDTSWPTAQKVGVRYYNLRNDLINRANGLNPTAKK
jgi:hypothetical protein